MLKQEVREAILAELHRQIEEQAAAVVQRLGNPTAIPNPLYPFDEIFTPEMKKALKELQLSNAARAGLLMLIKGAAHSVAYHFFAMVDGIAAPPQIRARDGKEIWGTYWPGITLSLHAEEFHDPYTIEYNNAYWAYKEAKKTGPFRTEWFS